MMLIDLAMDSKRGVSMLSDDAKKRMLKTRNLLKRYAFNPDATDKVEYFSIENANDVCSNAHFAMPPYADSYIELDRGKKGRIGYVFCADGRIYVIYGDDKEGIFTPFVYTRHERAKLFDNRFDEKELGRGYAAFKLLLMVGISLTSREAVGDFSQTEPSKMTAITVAMGVSDIYDVALVNRRLADQDIINDMVQECRGDLRSCITAMLLLMERRVHTITEVKASRGFVGSKLRAHPAHHVVTIDLDKDYHYFHRLFTAPTGTGVTPREHDVSSHWTHWNCSAQCQHKWVPFRSEEAEERDMEKHGRVLERYVCELCGGGKTRKPEFTRGDASKGRVTKQYKVIASKQKERKRGTEQGEHDTTEGSS